MPKFLHLVEENERAGGKLAPRNQRETGGKLVGTVGTGQEAPILLVFKEIDFEVIEAVGLGKVPHGIRLARLARPQKNEYLGSGGLLPFQKSSRHLALKHNAHPFYQQIPLTQKDFCLFCR